MRRIGLFLAVRSLEAPGGLLGRSGRHLPDDGLAAIVIRCALIGRQRIPSIDDAKHRIDHGVDGIRRFDTGVRDGFRCEEQKSFGEVRIVDRIRAFETFRRHKPTANDGQFARGRVGHIRFLHEETPPRLRYQRLGILTGAAVSTVKP